MIGDEESLACRITRYALENHLLWERDLSFLPGGANRLRLFLYHEVFQPSLRRAQIDFGVDPKLFG